MAEFPALPLFTDAFIADTVHLTAQQTGAYLMLLMAAWRTGDCRLPDDDKLLARYSRMELRAWRANKEIIMSFWKKDADHKWYQARLVDERNYVEDKRNKNVQAGKASALKRHKTTSTTVITESQPKYNEPTPHPTLKKDTTDAYAREDVPRETITSVFELGKKIGEFTGWNDSPSWTGNYSRLSGWLTQGWDFDLDILPTVKRLMEKKTGDPPTSLKYFERAIADAHAQRLKPIPKGNENATRSTSTKASKHERAKAAIRQSAIDLGYAGEGRAGQETPE